jgi:hypothetical protein
MGFLQDLFLPFGFQSQNIINPYMPQVEIFEFVHDIHTCYLENFKEQNLKRKNFNYIPLFSYEAFQTWNSRKNHCYIVHNI